MATTLLRLPAVQSASGLRRSTIYLQIREGLLPRPVKLGPRAVAWPESEIAAVLDARIAGKNDEEIRGLVKKLEAMRRKVA